MCQYHSKFTEFVDGLREQRSALNKQQSLLDKKISNLYHDLEGIEPAEEFALSFVKQLHGTLKKRRVIKDEIARLDAVLRPVMDITENVEEAVKSRKRHSKRWQHDFKMTMTLEEVISEN
ncbi:hypothetical protein DCE79_11095 [Lysinibacillus sp. 2017]|uniref:hypothetical protein n=1 Tax=unclassified Lysinibacillus TaxID=2636778 RepID=UPI000D52A08D|nr:MULTISPECIES: hypothetical protein [unclassified Lysinibacillus]AWE07898.1 hypothetical protein DCE79_11095 [Lysinibacillus sp. 2017]TGN33154.1 hypothetical protein E4L99_15040 [Lysinibacillus sp. S2017]